MADGYKIIIKGPSVSVDQEISEAQAKGFLVALFSGRAPSGKEDSKNPGHLSDPPPDELDGDSLAAYIGSSNAKSGPEKITAIGSFLKKHRATPTFDRAGLEQAFSDAAETVPRNIPRDLKAAVKATWIAKKPGEPGVYYVTGGGQQAVASQFKDNPRRRAAKARNRKKRKDA